MPGNENKPVPFDKAMDIDVVLLHDCTESQQPYIDTVRHYIKDAMAAVQSQGNLKGGTARYRVIPFWDHIEQGCKMVVDNQFNFTMDPNAIAKDLSSLVASGGGDGPEAQIDGLDAARRSPWRQTAKRIVILITDSPPHGVGEPGDSIPQDHPEALTHQVILNTYKKLNIQLHVLACVPEITYYEVAEKFYKDLTQSTSGLYVPIAEPSVNADSMKQGVIGCILHSINSLRTTERWQKWIVDQTGRRRDSIIDDMYSTLSQEGEMCHKVTCTEHRGVAHVQYDYNKVDRAFVESIVNKTLKLDTDMKANPSTYDNI